MSVKNKNIILFYIGCDLKHIVELHRKYGAHVHIFDDSCKLSARLLPYTCFHRVWEMTSETISMYINGFAEKYAEQIPVVAFSGKYTDIIRAATDNIESNCIIWREDLDFEGTKTVTDSGTDR